ncbi:hypothetical protein DEH18_24860 [Streptomyces sp. NHF165]|nr:hypothetical protein DEH18_24860 [Streptomyces sp. NHF165]
MRLRPVRVMTGRGTHGDTGNSRGNGHGAPALQHLRRHRGPRPRPGRHRPPTGLPGRRRGRPLGRRRRQVRQEELGQRLQRRLLPEGEHRQGPLQDARARQGPEGGRLRVRLRPR